MKTNVISGIISLGEVAADNGVIRIGRKNPSSNDYEFDTKVDGFFPLYAVTNGSGLIEKIFIDVNPYKWNVFRCEPITIISPLDVITGMIVGDENEV
ncbi:hypothetical protein QUF56_17385 [Ureibacillus composti]|nr:hypothetical protein [Ureibacillus composti]